MKKILINGLLINRESTGIGNYGSNLIKTIGNQNKSYDISALTQSNLDSHNVKLTIKNYNNSYKRILAEQFFLRKQYKNYELLHFIDYSSPVIKLNKPFIVTIHDLTFYRNPETFTLSKRLTKQLITPFSIKRANIVIADSENTKKDILDIFDIQESKVRVIYPGKPDYKPDRKSVV